MIISTINEAEAALLPYVPLVAQLTGKDTTLKRIKPLMQQLGNPQDRLRIIHIAGTSGKTSTAYYMAACLNASNLSTGLTVSPHVDSITERVQINGKPMSNEAFCQELGIFLDLVKRSGIVPSYFELLYAFALWVFEKYQVDYAVVETGMGGLFDATNVADRPDKVCIITDIGFDHMHILGYTLPEIARQKIGIAHKGNIIFMYKQSDEIMNEVHEWVDRQGAILKIVPDPEVLSEKHVLSQNMPNFQKRNWLLAQYVYAYLAVRDHSGYLTSQALLKTQSIRIPGRMDIQTIHKKRVIMDGAHNAQKMRAFVTSYKQLFPSSKADILIALKDGKNYQEVIPIIASIASRIIVTNFITSQDLPARSIDPDKIAALIKSDYRAISVECIPNLSEAYHELLNSSENHAIITGSFYLISQIRKLRA